MKDKSTIGIMEFVIGHIVLGVFFLVIYQKLIGVCAGEQYAEPSEHIFFLTMLFFSTFGIVFEWQTQRTVTNIILNILLSCGLCTIILFCDTYPGIMWVVLILVTIQAIAYTLFIMCKKNRSPYDDFVVFFLRLERVVWVGKYLYAFGMVIIIVLCMCTSLFTADSAEDESVKHTIENDIETLVKLESIEWHSLTDDEKLEVLQTVADIEQNNLGLPDKLNVRIKEINDVVLGYYKDSTHEICINADCFTYYEPWILLDTVCHEAYHSYQYRLVDVYDSTSERNKELMMFQTIDEYEQEFSHYISAEEDGEKYSAQKCESDAREYAHNQTDEYYRHIINYILSENLE